MLSEKKIHPSMQSLLATCFPTSTQSDIGNNISDMASSLYEISKYLEKIAPSIISGCENNNQTFEELAIRIYKKRKSREKIFGNKIIFGEPAWDILLDLFIAEQGKKRISVSSACIGSNVPITTAHRWLNELEASGFLIREHDDRDARRCYIRISAETCAMMKNYLAM